MKEKINEEINNLNYLMGYSRSKTLTENEMTPPSPTPPPNEEMGEKELEKPLSDEIDKYVRNLCKITPTTCEPCGIMLKLLATGKLKTKKRKNNIQDCLKCNDLQGILNMECMKLDGKIEAQNDKIAADINKPSKLKNTGEKIGQLSTIFLALTNLWTSVRNETKKLSEN